MIKSLNKRYDRIQEPWRMVLAISLFMIGIIPASNPAFGWKLNLFGWSWLFLLLGLRMVGSFKRRTDANFIGKGKES